MKSLFTFLFFATCMLQYGLAQQPAQYSMYMFNKFGYNPAYAGLDNSLSINGVYRNQWAGLEGNPETQTVNAHMPLYILGGGVGLAMENETLGSWKQTSLSVGYALQRNVGKNATWSLGISAGLVQRQLDGAKVKTPSTIFDSENNVINHNDAYLFNNAAAGMGPTASAGLFYRAGGMEVGVSAINLLGNELDLSGIAFGQQRTYLLYLGHQLAITDQIEFLPSLLLKSDANQTQVDFSLVGRFKENILFGTSFRGYHAESIDAIILLGGFKLSENTTIGYSYDLGLSKIKVVNNGSHEIWINYNLGKPIGRGKPPHIIYNPRWL